MRDNLRWIGLGLIPAALVVSMALGAPGSQVPDDQDAEEAKFFGRRTFVENCRICHGEEMSSRQRLTTKQWTAEVEKMINWGAPVPPEQKPRLIAYLASSFSDKTPPPPFDTSPAAELLIEDEALLKHPAAVGDPAKGAPLYAQHCALCHGNAGQGADLGPRLAERPILLNSPVYHEAVAKGRDRMPGFAAALKAEDQDHILGWLREQPGDVAER